MKRTGSDWWKLYHDDFWDDEHVLKLSAAQAGVYLFLLGLQAKHGKLPEDPESVALLCRRFWKRRTEWDALWAVLARFFPTSDTLRARFNPRQAFELTEIEADRGKETGRKARWRASQAGLSRDCPGGTNADVPGERRGEEKEKRPEERRPKRARRAGGAPTLPVSLDTPDFQAAWTDWLTYRNELGLKPWLPSTVDRNWKEWGEWGPERAVAAIRFTMLKQYQGIVEPQRNGMRQGELTGLAAVEEFERRLDERERTVDVKGSSRAAS